MDGEWAVTLLLGGSPVWPRRWENRLEQRMVVKSPRDQEAPGMRAQSPGTRAYRHPQHPVSGCQLAGDSLSPEGRGHHHTLPCLGSG